VNLYAADFWHDPFMLTYIAASPDTSAHLKDFIAPVAAVCGAVIAGVVSWANARKTPPDRLQALIDIYRNWPGDDVDGRKQLAQSITLEIAEMRPRSAKPDDEIAKAGGATRERVELVVSFVVFVGGVWWAVCAFSDHPSMFVVACLVSGFSLFFLMTHIFRFVREKL
jgi:hypothetical protein